MRFFKSVIIVASLTLLTVSTVAVVSAVAQDSGNAVAITNTLPPSPPEVGAPPIDPATISGFVQPFVNALAGKYGWVVKALTVLGTVVGILRVVFKPVMLVVEAVVKATPSTADDAKMAAFEKGPIYKWLVWGLDWLSSIKSPNAPTTNPLVKTS